MKLFKIIFSLLTKHLLAIGMILAVFASSVLAQAYVVEMQGVWKKSNGVIVKNRTHLDKGIELRNTSEQADDSIALADEDGIIVKVCSNGCRSIVVPNTQKSLGRYLWCRIIGCGSTKNLSFFGTKSEECKNFDGIAVIDKNGITDLSPALELLQNKSKNLNLQLYRNEGDSVEKIPVDNPKVDGLKIGIYDVVEGNLTSRVLVLPTEVYNREKKLFEELKRKIKYWKEKGLSNCTIKSFTQAYIDYVTKKNEKKIKS